MILPMVNIKVVKMDFMAIIVQKISMKIVFYGIENVTSCHQNGICDYCLSGYYSEGFELSYSENCIYNNKEGICNKIDGNWRWVMIILLLLQLWSLTWLI